MNAAASCIRNDPIQGEYCVCPDGFIHDFVWGRFSNCALPTWFLPTYFAFTTIGTVWTLALILPGALFRLKSRLKKAALCYCLSVSLEWLHVLCVFLQQGNFIPALVFLLFFPPVMLFTAYLMFKIIIDPVCTALGGRYVRRRAVLQVYFVSIAAALFIVQSATLAFADVESKAARDMFNLLFVVQMFLFAFAYPVTALIIVLQTQQLIDTIQSCRRDSQPPDQALEFFLGQLRALRKTAKILALNFVVLIPIPIAIIVIGSIPYQFVLWAINMSGIWPATYVIRRIIRAREKDEAAAAAKHRGSIVDYFIRG